MDVIFCTALLALFFASIYWIWTTDHKMLIGLPFITFHFVFLGIAKTQFGPLGKRLANKRIGPHLLVIGVVLCILGTLM